MIVLGIDPAIRTTGYGVVEADLTSGEIKILDCGIIANTPKMAHSECVRRLYGGVAELLNLWHPDCAVLEDPFVGRNAKTAIILGMARGAILASFATNNLPAYSYSPTVAKRAATGFGGAEKERIAYLLSAEFGIEVDRIPLDSTDALALAICHIHKTRNPELFKAGKVL